MLPFPSMMISGAGATVVGAKQYWRLDFPTGSQTDTFVEISEWEIRTAFGGSRQDSSTGGSASTNASGATYANAFDGNNGSAWSTTSGNAVGAWLANNCGSGKDAIEMYIRSGEFDKNNSPDSLTISYSDDGATWTADSRWPALSPTSWVPYEYRILQRTDQPGATVKRGTYSPMTSSINSWTGYTIREQLLATRYPIGGSSVKLWIKGGSGEAMTINKCYIGKKGTGTLDFASTPTQVLFSGSASVVIPASTEVACDLISLSHTSSEPLVVAIYCGAGNAAADTLQFTTSSGSGGYKAGDDSTTPTASGYTSYNGFLVRAEFTP